MDHDIDIATELRARGSRLWESVECDVRSHGVVVYARLYPHETVDVATALAESERLIQSVLTRRLDGHKTWVAAVQWSERLCKTFTPPPEVRDELAARRALGAAPSAGLMRDEARPATAGPPPP